jgi:hypothetical protein
MGFERRGAMSKTHDRILLDSAQAEAMSITAYCALMRRFATYLETMHVPHVTVRRLAEYFHVRQGTIYTMIEDASAHGFVVFVSGWDYYPGDALVEWGGYHPPRSRTPA